MSKNNFGRLSCDWTRNPAATGQKGDNQLQLFKKVDKMLQYC